MSDSNVWVVICFVSVVLFALRVTRVEKKILELEEKISSQDKKLTGKKDSEVSGTEVTADE